MTPTWLLNIYRANLVAQVGIVVTGGLVRLTGSGLGCPTWPQCVDGSLVPTERQEENFHKFIEFGNRLLTFVLGLLALAAIVGTITWVSRHRPLRGRKLIVLAGLPLIGTIGQAVLGGITVLTGLHPAIVAAHFLVSIAIIGGVVYLLEQAQQQARPPTPVPKPFGWYLTALVVVAGVVVVLGTLVTGSGPNAGDADVSVRFSFDQRIVAWLHADIVLLFVGMVLGLAMALFLRESLRPLARRSIYLGVVVAANGFVGYVQLFTGLPWLPVAVHMLLACLVWVSVLRLRLAATSRALPQPESLDLRHQEAAETHTR